MGPQVFIFDGVLAYVGTISDTDEHRHHAFQLTVAHDGTLEVTSRGQAYCARAALIPPDEPHQLRCNSQLTTFVFFEPEMFEPSAAGRVATVDTCSELCVFHGPARRLREARTASAAREILTEMIGALCSLKQLTTRHRTDRSSDIMSPSTSWDPRVQRTCERIKDVLPDQVRVQDLARAEHLSASRLAHLFSSQVGIPIKRYALWRRIHTAARATRAGATMTEVAHAAGFSDLAHLSRTVHAMFGLPPSALAENSEFVQGDSLWND